MQESEMIRLLECAKDVLLIEPEYKRKYIPLGLAKIATFIKEHGGKVTFSRKYESGDYDLICVTSLFTYDSGKVLKVLGDIRAWRPSATVLIGGVYASLMANHILSKFPNVLVFTGYSQILDSYPPDYSIDWGIEDKWKDFSFVFTSRGCPNDCPYCAVKRTEPEIWINPDWKSHIDLSKPYVMISDNNLSSQPMWHIKAVCDFLTEHKKRVVFDNGFDCKHITPELASMVGKLKFIQSGMRMAFDRIEEDGIFQKAIQMLIDGGVKKSSLMAYILFNFMDKPKEAVYRASECVRLGVRPYPQMFTPLNTTSRDKDNIYVGKYWTLQLARAFRYFYLMAGIYTKTDFVTWAKSQDKVKLTEEDWKVYNA